MPRYLKQDGTKVPNERFEKTWIEIPVRAKKGTTALDSEHYLVPPRVSQYIVLLESKINGKLPKLPRK